MITNNNDNIVQQWITLKSKKKMFQHSTMGSPISITIAFTFAHLRRNLSFCFVSSHHPIPSCRRLTFQSKRCFNSSDRHHRMNILSRSDFLNCKNVGFFLLLLVIVYKYRNKINYSMLASYCCRLRVLSLPPSQILCHPLANDGFETMPVGLR